MTFDDDENNFASVFLSVASTVVEKTALPNSYTLPLFNEAQSTYISALLNTRFNKNYYTVSPVRLADVNKSYKINFHYT